MRVNPKRRSVPVLYLVVGVLMLGGVAGCPLPQATNKSGPSGSSSPNRQIVGSWICTTFPFAGGTVDFGANGEWMKSEKDRAGRALEATGTWSATKTDEKGMEILVRITRAEGPSEGAKSETISTDITIKKSVTFEDIDEITISDAPREQNGDKGLRYKRR